MTCPECKDTGYVTLLFSREPCSTCGPGSKKGPKCKVLINGVAYDTAVDQNHEITKDTLFVGPPIAASIGWAPRNPESDQAHEDMVLTQVQGEPDRPELDYPMPPEAREKIQRAARIANRIATNPRESIPAPTIRAMQQRLTAEESTPTKQGPPGGMAEAYVQRGGLYVWNKGWWQGPNGHGLGGASSAEQAEAWGFTPIPRWEDVTDWEDPPEWVMAPDGTSEGEYLNYPFVFNDHDWHETEASAMAAHEATKMAWRDAPDGWERALYQRHPTHPNILQRVWKRGD